jgi:para-nitrobenzyl esterase
VIRPCLPGPQTRLTAASIFLIALALPANAAYNPSLTKQVATANSTRSSIQGEIDPTNAGAQRFLGIPFAAPPVGALRWHAPADPPAWPGSRRAARFGNQCSQVSGLFDPSANPANFGTITGSEDCLYLNVFRPNTSQSGLPVFYWIYGGANLAGGANDPMYEGAKFATTNNVIVVTANYRLGMLGFLYEKALHTGSNTAEDNSGNFTTLDLLKGLNWVNRNIAIFGGNPDNITIGGQSAGCIDTWGLIQSPLAVGKFRQAICMSGLPNMYSTAYGQGFAHQMEAGLLMDQHPGMTFKQADAKRASLRLSELAALLNLASAAEILKNTPQPVNPGHFTDGTVISARFGVPGIFDCSYDSVPMIIGSVDTEGSLFVGLGGGWQVSQQTLWGMMNSGTPMPSDSAIIAPAFRQVAGQPFSSSGYAKTTKVLSDVVVFLTDQVNRYLQAQILCSRSAVYRYQFKWENEPQPWRDIYGSEHAIDVPFVFGNFTTPSFLGYAYTSANFPDRQDLSKLMNSYFANFLWNGNPNNTRSNPNPYPNAPNWNAWTDIVGLKKRMMLNAGPGKADAGKESSMSNAEELAAPTEILSLPPAGYTFSKSFLESFVPEQWLTVLGLSIPSKQR